MIFFFVIFVILFFRFSVLVGRDVLDARDDAPLPFSYLFVIFFSLRGVRMRQCPRRFLCSCTLLREAAL